MRLRIFPGRAQGSIAAPPSKSMAHRLLIAAALSKGTSVLSGVSLCQDVMATVDCLRALGITAEWQGSDTVAVTGNSLFELPDGEITLPCRESGSTIRFFLPMALLSGREVTLTGAFSLLSRPMKVYEALCHAHHLHFVQNERGITVKGQLTSGEYTMPGNVSSQFISGMLFALTQTSGRSTLHILPPVESRSYILLTVDALQAFGADIAWLDDCTLRINGDAVMQAHDTAVEGDYSNAAFLEALALVGGNVTVQNLKADSLQGDRVYRELFAKLQAGFAEISLEDCPDLAPILFSLAATLHGGHFTDTRRLRIKESDRAAVMAEELRKFGASVTVGENDVTVTPTAFHAPAELLCGHNDHRVVMSLSVLCTLTGGTVDGCEAVTKSYPAFFEDIASLGIRFEEI